MRGMGGVYKRGPFWWIRYGHRGRKYRESSQSTKRHDAVRLLKQRLTDLAEGRPGALAEELVTFAEIAAAYMDERTLKGVPAVRLQWSRARVTHLNTFFGAKRAVQITTGMMREYAKARLAEGAAAATVNRDPVP